MPEVILKNLPFLLSGLRLTAEIALWSILGGTILGLTIGVVRHLRVPVLAQLSAVYVGFVRGTPLLVMVFICYFGLPALLAYKTSAYAAAIVGFILFIAAYLAEDIRTGLRSVQPGLVQAAFATGLTHLQTVRPDHDYRLHRADVSRALSRDLFGRAPTLRPAGGESLSAGSSGSMARFPM